MPRDLLTGRFLGESPDTGARYIAREGRVYARTGEGERAVSTALSANGRELDRFERAFQAAKAQRKGNSRK